MNHPARIALFLLTLSAACANAPAADYFVSPTGDDAGDGTKDKPFATIQHAQGAANPGDTVYVRGGHYVMHEDQIAKRERIWAYVTFLDKSGTKGKPIRYWAFEDERPVFDFSKVKPAGVRIDAFYVPASWVHIKGLEVIGVQVTHQGPHAIDLLRQRRQPQRLRAAQHARRAGDRHLQRPRLRQPVPQLRRLPQPRLHLRGRQGRQRRRVRLPPDQREHGQRLPRVPGVVQQ